MILTCLASVFIILAKYRETDQQAAARAMTDNENAQATDTLWRGGAGPGEKLSVDAGRTLNVPWFKMLSFVEQTGWHDSAVHVSKNQKYAGATSLYQGNCNMHGENLIGRCFCLPGWTGKMCEHQLQQPVTCTNRDDRCFFTEEAGVFAVSYDRWHLSQETEKSTWNMHVKVSNDRVGDHMQGFSEYKHVGPDGLNLGMFMEVGAGPWTQSLFMMEKRRFSADKFDCKPIDCL